jgi:hypothetical protein
MAARSDSTVESDLAATDPPGFETWQHGTPDAALTLSRLKEAPEIDTVLIKRGVMLVDFKSKKEVIHVNLSISYLLGT